MNEEGEQKTDGKEEGDDDEDEPNLLCVCVLGGCIQEKGRGIEYIYIYMREGNLGLRAQEENYKTTL